MRLFFTKRFMAAAVCAAALTSIIPAVPVYAGTRTQQSSNSRNEKMRKAAEQVQKAFEKKDLNKLADLCSYPVVVSFKSGELAELKSKEEFMALGSQTIFTQKMTDAIASTNVAKLTDGEQAGTMMGGDYGLTLYKVKGKWKINNFYLDAGSTVNSNSVNISDMKEMAEQIQKTFPYKSLETLSKMCNYPIIITNSNGKMTEIKSAEQLIALGEDKVFTEKLSKEIDNTDITRLEEVGSAGVMMGGDSGLNMYKFNGYWKINQIYQ